MHNKAKGFYLLSPCYAFSLQSYDKQLAAFVTPK